MRFVSDGDESRVKRMGFVLRGMVDEVTDELTELDDTQLSTYFQYVAAVVGWIGTGKMDQLPEELLKYTEEATTKEPLRLESA